MLSLSLFILEMGWIWEACMHLPRSRVTLGKLDEPIELKSLDVTVQSTKIAIDADGVIAYRAGYGKGTGKDWIAVFEKLTKETSET